MSYYYVLVSDPFEIKTTDYIDDLITILYDGEAEFISDGQRIELKLPNDYFSTIKRQISEYDDKVPLYDIKSNHLFLIHQFNVYPRIYFEDYRFVDKEFYNDLISGKDLSDIDKNNIRILSHYDLDILYSTYMRIFYNSYVINSYITNCRRPSFASGMEHIKPYYTINELYFMAYDWNLTKKLTLNNQEINHFCKQIAKYDIPAETLLNHQMYIYDSKAIGLVKHYSLFGSYYMNSYLRKYQCCLPGKQINTETIIRNLYLENQIKIMIKLINHSPEFTKSHTVYRFVETDDYLRHLKIGDIYQDSSFMSTTRNPFYYMENYAFGYILIKITIPKNIKGIGLCIEAYSNFPNEEEIILPPTTKYRLISYTDNEELINFQEAFGIPANKKYEFEWIGNNYIGKTNNDVSIDIKNGIVPSKQIVDLKDLLDNPNIKNLSISDRLSYFRDTYARSNNQFTCVIGTNEYTFNFEAYNSTSVYKEFFYYEIKDGIMVTTSNPRYGNINLLMELGPEIHVNYYFRFSVTDPSIVVDINRPEWIEWLSLFAYVIGSRNVVIHSNYILQYNKNDTISEKQMKTRYTFSQNIYLYMKDKIKLFEYIEITPKFDYSWLDYLFGYSVTDVIKSTDRDELYRVYQTSNVNNMGDFWLYIVERYPKLIKTIQDKMDIVYNYDSNKNPFKNISYNLDAWMYLNDNYYIQYIPSDKEFTIRKGSFKKLIGSKKIEKFKNRLRTYLMSS